MISVPEAGTLPSTSRRSALERLDDLGREPFG
jgi:hypothetical protein